MRTALGPREDKEASPPQALPLLRPPPHIGDTASLQPAHEELLTRVSLTWVWSFPPPGFSG